MSFNPHAHIASDAEVESLRQEVSRLRELVDVADSGTAEARYFELHKRHRELNVKYEAERARAQKLMTQLAEDEKQRLADQQRGTRGVVLPSDRMAPRRVGAEDPVETSQEELQREVDELKGRLDRAQKSNASLRKMNDELKRDVGKMRKVVALEVGDDAETALAAMDDTEASPAQRSSSAGTPSKPPGWKARAQQIALLKSKTKELQRQLTASRQQLAAAGLSGDFRPADGDFDTMSLGTGVTGMTGVRSMATGVTGVTAVTNAESESSKRDFDDVNRERIERKEQRRLMETREAAKAVDTARAEAEKEKSRADALQARLQNLERDNQHLRLCVGRMIEKTENDDALIAEYKSELERQREELKQSALRPEPDSARRAGPSRKENELAQEISRMQETISDLRRKQASATATTPLDAIFEAKGVRPDDATLLGDAVALIQSQREAIYSMERQLAKRDAGVPKGSDVAPLVREENASLRERIATLTEVSEREILLYKRSADTYRAATTPQTVGGALPQGRPRRDSGSVSSRPQSSEAGPTARDNNANDNEEVERLRQQYNDLKRAYNALAMKQ